MKLSCLPVSFYPDFRSGQMDISGWSAMAEKFGLDSIDLSVLITRCRIFFGISGKINIRTDSI